MGFNNYTHFLGFMVFASVICLVSASPIDFITSSKFIKDPDTLSSGDFKLGFFSPVNSTNRYVGIWYRSESNIIWVANRNKPLRDSSGVVTLSDDGNLVVLNGQNLTLWYSDVSANITPSPTTIAQAQLLETGNLVLQVKDNSTGMSRTAWESFQHPSDSWLPMMKLGFNTITGKNIKVTAWKSPSDPSIGTFSAGIGHSDPPELFTWNGSRPYGRTGPFQRQLYIGLNGLSASSSFVDYGMSTLQNEPDGTISLSFELLNKHDFAIFKLDSTGKWAVSMWRNQNKIWTWSSKNGEDECELYGRCGKFAVCDSNSSAICTCLSGFEARNLEEWNRNNRSSGCVRKAPLQCYEDGFMKVQTVKVPDFAERSNVREVECRTQCLQNCSCVAYAYNSNIGCMTWSVDLIDITKLYTSSGIDLNIRLSSSEFDNNEKQRKAKVKAKPILIRVTIGTVGTIIVAVCVYMFWRWAAKHAEIQSQRAIGVQKPVTLDELPVYDFEVVTTATNNFHLANTLGKGGFGPVYKGLLPDGLEIAVKRLSRASGQGLEEFMNEVGVISKLQHRNLVRLLGCCIEGDEKMLIYEFLPNKSLDTFIFDPFQRKHLNWTKRFNIIDGIARGLLYLHRDSRLRIIHRDLKASNILLDEEMNPKISDFGLARIYKGEDEVNTRRVVGTYGYMSPEYAMGGLFSEKSDVYSFGVLLLEIVSGKRNTSFRNDEQSPSLIEFAWKLWNEDNIRSLIDPEISASGFENQILRCIHIAFLCVQEIAKERPTMVTVVLMLNSEISHLPPPRQVAFVQKQNSSSLESSQSQENQCKSNNNVTLSDIQPR